MGDNRSRLNEKHRGGIRFSLATPTVLRDEVSLEATGNRSYGANVYVATGRPYSAQREALTTGQTIAEGAVERFGSRELRCARVGSRLEIAVFQGPRRLTRTLQYALRKGDDPAAVDEGWFTWFGPVEDICTPWSDNDPSVCQVITVDDLRAFARDPQG